VKPKDRLFIFLSIVLMILFAASVLENISSFVIRRSSFEEPVQTENIGGILTRLEEAGLRPREAKYYEVIE